MGPVPFYACLLSAIALAAALGCRTGTPGFWGGPLADPARKARRLAALFGLFVLGMQIQRWRSFHVYTDTTIEMQVIHNLAFGRGPIASVHASMFESTNVFGYHLSLVYLPVAAIYRLVPHPFAIYALWATALAAPCWMLGRWGRETFGETRAALAPPLLYLLHPTLQHAALFEIHPTPFAAPFLLGAVLAARRGDAARYALWGAAAALAREDMTLMAGAVAAWGALASRCRRTSLALLAACVAWYFAATHAIAPRLSPEALRFRYHDYEHLGAGPGGLLAAPFVRPGAFFGTLVEPAKIASVLLLFLPLSMRPWRRPRDWLMFAPVQGLLLLSNSLELYCPYTYYTVPLLPLWIVCAAPEPAAPRAGRAWGGMAAGSVAATILAGALPVSAQFWSVRWPLGTFAEPYWHASSYRRSPSAEAVERLLERIDDEAPCLPNYLLPRFLDRAPRQIPDVSVSRAALLDRAHPNRYGFQALPWEEQRKTLEAAGFAIAAEDGPAVLFLR